MSFLWQLWRWSHQTAITLKISPKICQTFLESLAILLKTILTVNQCMGSQHLAYTHSCSSCKVPSIGKSRIEWRREGEGEMERERESSFDIANGVSGAPLGCWLNVIRFSRLRRRAVFNLSLAHLAGKMMCMEEPVCVQSWIYVCVVVCLFAYLFLHVSVCVCLCVRVCLCVFWEHINENPIYA